MEKLPYRDRLSGSYALMRSIWRRVQHWPVWLRWPVKWVIFAGVSFLVLYPRPALFVRHVQHIRQMNRLPDPADPAVGPVAARFDAFLSGLQTEEKDPRVLLAAVEAFVRREIPYSWDWQTWGVVDYLPTVSEVITKGTEDCDGRAVLAATLLRAKGIDARLVGDPRHMWVSTPQGDTMEPLGAPVFRADDRGMSIRWRKLLDAGPIAFGVSIFPWGRQVVILVTAWLLALPLGRVKSTSFARRGCPAVALGLLLAALVVTRRAGADPLSPDYRGIGVAVGMVVAGAIVLGVAGRGSRHDRRQAAGNQPG